MVAEIQSAACAISSRSFPVPARRRTRARTPGTAHDACIATVATRPPTLTPRGGNTRHARIGSSGPFILISARVDPRDNRKRNCGKRRGDVDGDAGLSPPSLLEAGVLLPSIETGRRWLPAVNGGRGEGAAAGGGAEGRHAGADHREHRRLHRRHRGARPALRLPHRRLARRRSRRRWRRGRDILLHAPAAGMQRQAARARDGGRRRAAPLQQLHLRRPGREVLRPDGQALHGGHHHPVADGRHRGVPRVHRPERVVRVRRRGRTRWPADAGHRGPRAAAARPGGAVAGPLAVVARAVQHPRRRVHRAGRGNRGEAGPPAPCRARRAAVPGPGSGRGALGRRVRRRLRRLLLRGLLHDAGARGVHGRPQQVPLRAPPGHRRRHRRVRLLRRLRLPRLRRRHQGHHHAQPPDHLVHRRRQGGAVHRAGPDVPGDDAPDPRDRGGAASGAGRVAAEALPRRRRPGAGSPAREPRGGADGAVGDRVLRAGVRVVRVLRGEHGVRAALLRAARAVPPPRRGPRRGRRAARRRLGHPPLRPRVRRARPVRRRPVAALTAGGGGGLVHVPIPIHEFLFHAHEHLC